MEIDLGKVVGPQGPPGPTGPAGGLTFDNIYPVGSIYMSVNNVNPSTLFGGTWEAWGAGKVPVGVNTGESEFNTVEKTGGEKTHELSASEMPSHSHTVNSHNHSIPSLKGTAASAGAHTHSATWKYSKDVPLSGKYGRLNAGGNVSSSSGITINSAGAHTHSVTTNASTTGNSSPGTNAQGGGQAHNNLQPYITCFMWKRTA